MEICKAKRNQKDKSKKNPKFAAISGSFFVKQIVIESSHTKFRIS